MADDWGLAMHAALSRDARSATVPEPDDLPDEPDENSVQKVRWDRIATPGGGWIDQQLVASSAGGYRRRLLVIDFNPRDPEHARRIEAAIRMLSEC